MRKKNRIDLHLIDIHTENSKLLTVFCNKVYSLEDKCCRHLTNLYYQMDFEVPPSSSLLGVRLFPQSIRRKFCRVSTKLLSPNQSVYKRNSSTRLSFSKFFINIHKIKKIGFKIECIIYCYNFIFHLVRIIRFSIPKH